MIKTWTRFNNYVGGNNVKNSELLKLSFETDLKRKILDIKAYIQEAKGIVATKAEYSISRQGISTVDMIQKSMARHPVIGIQNKNRKFLIVMIASV